MKVAITGSTSPIGILLSKLSDAEVVCVPRYDLLTDEGLKSTLGVVVECDHFINLANVGTSQSWLLWNVYSAWLRANHPGKIISFGSLASEASVGMLSSIGADFQMVANKLLLEKIHNELCFSKPFGAQPQSTLLRFGHFASEDSRMPMSPATTPEGMLSVVNFVLRTDTYISGLDFREI